MLSQEDADLLIQMIKRINENNPTQFKFPPFGQYDNIELNSINKQEEFIIDINRKGHVYKNNKCTFQNRCRKDIILLRLDINAREHTNPNGEKLGNNHLHIYKEGYRDAFAYPVPDDIIKKSDNLVDFLIHFLKYNNVENYSELNITGNLF